MECSVAKAGKMGHGGKARRGNNLERVSFGSLLGNCMGGKSGCNLKRMVDWRTRMFYLVGQQGLRDRDWSMNRVSRLALTYYLHRALGEIIDSV